MNIKNVTHWKSTVMGLVGLAIAAAPSIKFDSAGHFAMTQRDCFMVAVGIASAVIGAVQKDAQ